jgi:Membrane magnesium transporter
MAVSTSLVSPSLMKAIFVAGICVLLHSAISAAQHRSFQRINRQVREAGSVDANVEELSLPLDIWLETLSSACLILWSFVHMTVKLKNIRPEAEYENRTSESLDFRPSFMVFGQKESLYRLRLLDQNTGGSFALEEPLLQREEPTEEVPPLEE